MIPITKYHMLNDGMKEKFIKSFWNVIHNQLSSDTTNKKNPEGIFLYLRICVLKLIFIFLKFIKLNLQTDVYLKGQTNWLPLKISQLNTSSIIFFILPI